MPTSIRKAVALSLSLLFWLMFAIFAGQVVAQSTTASYAGTYSGTFSGGDSGTFTAVISSSGGISLAGNSSVEGSISGSGQVSSTGDLQMTAGSTSTGSSFTGTINPTSGALTGTWTNSEFGVNGSFTGTRANVTPTKTNQTITFAAPMTNATTGALTNVGGTKSVNAYASSGLVVSFSSLTPTVCSVSGNAVSGLTAGTCAVAANQSGDNAYSPAAQVTQSVIIGKASQTLTFGDMPVIPLGGVGTLQAIASSGLSVSFSTLTPGSCSVNGNFVTGIAIGACTIAANQVGNANYTAAPQATQSVTVSANSGLTFSIQSLVFASQKVGGISAPQVLTLTNTSGAVLNVAYVAATGDYKVTTTCAGALAVNASCIIQVTFVATYPGERNGTISVKSDALNSPSLLPVTGIATYTVLSYPLKLEAGWNLLGNSINKIINVPRIFGQPDVVTTVWKWDSVTSGWQFYTPSLTPMALQTYAASKGYAVLTDINPGEGYWVNAKVKTTLPSPTAAAFERTAEFLAPGWNLVATGLDLTPSEFNNSLKALTPAGSMTSLWAWNSLLSQWYFYAPALDAQSDSTLRTYIANKGYLDFASNNKTLGKGLGFWVNNSATNVTPPVVISGFTAMGLPFGSDNLLKQDGQGRDYIENDDRVFYVNGYNPQGTYVSYTESGSNGKISLKQSAKEVGTFIWGKVEGTWFGKKVTQIAVGLNSGLNKLTNNVNSLTTLVTKAYVAEVATDVPADNIPPNNLPSNPGVFDKSWQGLKTVLGPLASKLGSNNPSEDSSYRPDPSSDAIDQTVERILTTDSGNGQVSFSDKSGNAMANVSLKKIAANTATGDAETVSQTETDKAIAASDLMAAIQSQLTVYQSFFATARPDAADPGLAALFDESFTQNGQGKKTYLTSLPTRTEPAVGSTIAGELANAPIGLQVNDASHQWFKMWVTQSGGGTGEDWLAIKDGQTGKWLLGGNQLGATPTSDTLKFSAPIFNTVLSEYYEGTTFSYVGQPGQPIEAPAFYPISPPLWPLTTSQFDISWYAFFKPWPRCRYSLNTLNQDESLLCELELFATISCWIKTPADPTVAPNRQSCASLNIRFNRSAGTLSFTSTQLHEILTPSNTNSVSGSLSFAPF